jgi:DNA-binding CsgD family transcriptional regulator
MPSARSSGSGSPRGQVTAEVRAAIKRYRHQDLLTPVDGTAKYSDFLSSREFHRLELYQEVCRPLGIEDMMRVWLSPSGEGRARLEFDRASRDFGERDRTVLELLVPHLRQFSRNAMRLRRLRRQAGGASVRLTPRERQILGRVAEGRTNAEIAWHLGISAETVRKHLENAYDKLGVHTRTGAVAALFGLVGTAAEA